MRAKNFIKASFLFTTFFFVTSCSETEKVEPVVNQQQSSLKTNYDLPEITITEQYTYDSNLFNDIYSMSVGNDYHATANPYTALTTEYAGENLEEIPGYLAEVIRMINNKLIEKYHYGLKDEEIAFMKENCSALECLAIWAVLGLSLDYQKQLLATTFYGEGVDDGFANAIIHTFMSNRMRWVLGKELGAGYMAAHEARETGISTQMDAYNNAIGNNAADIVSTKELIDMAKQRMLWSIQNGKLGQYPYVPKTPRNPQQL